MMRSMTLVLNNEQEMRDFGKQIALLADGVHVIYLQGVLGAGKTTLSRGFLQGLGYAGAVKSPTYTLVETYLIPPRTIHHFDLYRMHALEELEELGFRDYFTDDTLCLIEWPENGQGRLPDADLVCHLEVAGLLRKMTVTAQTESGEKVVQHLSKSLLKGK
jgi:tRNA threonylcarbamoyladenosine biosynthesis protein TsaE